MMAEDKSQRTEKPTPRHKRDARKEGRVARSAEIGSWFSLGVVACLLPYLGEHAMSEVAGFMSLAANAMPAADPAQAIPKSQSPLPSFGLYTMDQLVPWYHSIRVSGTPLALS